MTKRVRVRALRFAERWTLPEKLRTTTLTVRVHQRYGIIAEMARGRTVAETAERGGQRPERQRTAFLFIARTPHRAMSSESASAAA